MAVRHQPSYRITETQERAAVAVLAALVAMVCLCCYWCCQRQRGVKASRSGGYRSDTALFFNKGWYNSLPQGSAQPMEEGRGRGRHGVSMSASGWQDVHMQPSRSGDYGGLPLHGQVASRNPRHKPASVPFTVLPPCRASSPTRKIHAQSRKLAGGGAPGTRDKKRPKSRH